MPQARPKLSSAKKSFKEVYGDIGKSVSAVGSKIGGKVDYNINVVPVGKGRFENACAIRLSYVLNNNGVKIPFINGQTVSGKDGNWYIYKVTTIIKFMKMKFGEPDVTFKNPNEVLLSKHKGILVFEVDAWRDATGHATIWDGAHCSDKCYFPLAQKAYLWKLKN